MTDPADPSLTRDVARFLAENTPSETNRICECAANDICVYHQSTRLIERLELALRSASPLPLPPERANFGVASPRPAGVMSGKQPGSTLILIGILLTVALVTWLTGASP